MVMEAMTPGTGMTTMEVQDPMEQIFTTEEVVVPGDTVPWDTEDGAPTEVLPEAAAAAKCEAAEVKIVVDRIRSISFSFIVQPIALCVCVSLSLFSSVQWMVITVTIIYVVFERICKYEEVQKR